MHEAQTYIKNHKKRSKKQKQIGGCRLSTGGGGVVSQLVGGVFTHSQEGCKNITGP